MNAVASEAVTGTTAASKKKTEYEKVTMTDGRVVEFPKARKLSKQSFITGEDNHSGPPMVRLDFANGETRSVEIPGGELLKQWLDSLDPNKEDEVKLIARIKHFMKAATHGYEQKLGDEMAYSATKKDEPEPTLEDKIEWVDELISRLQSLEWTVAREGGGGLAGAGFLLAALVELSGKTKDEIRAFLKPLSKDERAALKRASPVKEKIAELEDAAAKKNGVDGNALLANLGLNALGAQA